jgi:hypothetical protein
MLRNAPEILQERVLRALARLRPGQLRALVEQLGLLVAALELDADVAGMFFEDESPGTVPQPVSPSSSALTETRAALATGRPSGTIRRGGLDA